MNAGENDAGSLNEAADVVGLVLGRHYDERLFDDSRRRNARRACRVGRILSIDDLSGSIHKSHQSLSQLKQRRLQYRIQAKPMDCGIPKLQLYFRSLHWRTRNETQLTNRCLQLERCVVGSPVLRAKSIRFVRRTLESWTSRKPDLRTQNSSVVRRCLRVTQANSVQSCLPTAPSRRRLHLRNEKIHSRPLPL